MFLKIQGLTKKQNGLDLFSLLGPQIIDEKDFSYF